MLIPRHDVLVEYLEHLDRTLSRTVSSGKVSQATSLTKRAPLVTGDALMQLVETNRKEVARQIEWRATTGPCSTENVISAIVGIAQIALVGIVPRSIFREWSYDPKQYSIRNEEPLCPPELIWSGLVQLGDRAFQVVRNGGQSSAECIPEIEWDLVAGPLHPFYDGCGRVSRYFSTLLYLWTERSPKVHLARDEYFHALRRGKVEFGSYCRSLRSAFNF